MEAVKSGRLSVNRAANKYNMPKTTLKDQLSGRVKHGSNPGLQPYLTSSKENELEKFLIEICKMGHGKTKREVIDIVRRTVEKKMKKRARILKNMILEGRDDGKDLHKGIQIYLCVYLMPYHTLP